MFSVWSIGLDNVIYTTVFNGCDGVENFGVSSSFVDRSGRSIAKSFQAVLLDSAVFRHLLRLVCVICPFAFTGLDLCFHGGEPSVTPLSDTGLFSRGSSGILHRVCFVSRTRCYSAGILAMALFRSAHNRARMYCISARSVFQFASCLADSADILARRGPLSLSFPLLTILVLCVCKMLFLSVRNLSVPG